MNGSTLQTVEDGSDPDRRLEWQVEVRQPGSYTVEVTASSKYGGAHVAVAVGGAIVERAFPGTGSWQASKTVSLGRLDIAAAGRQTVTLTVTSEGKGSMNLLNLTLKPDGVAAYPL